MSAVWKKCCRLLIPHSGRATRATRATRVTRATRATRAETPNEGNEGRDARYYNYFSVVGSQHNDSLGKPAVVAYTLSHRIRGLSSPESDQLWLSLIPIGSLTPIGSLLKNIARGVREAAPSAIGHLKGVLSSRSISIAFSLTDFTAENLQSSKAGDLSSYESIPGSKWTLVINAVAYGISERLLSEIGSRCWEAFKMELAAD